MRRPKHVIWDVTYACPLRCGHCYSESGRRASRELPLALKQRLVDIIIGMKPTSVAFSGGEPMLVRELPDLAARLDRAGIHVRAHLSGSHAPLDAIEALAKSASLISVSIDGGTAEIHDHVRGRSGAFNKAVALLQQLAALKSKSSFKLHVDFCLLKSNLDQVGDFCEHISAQVPELDQVFFSATMPVGLASRDSFVRSELLDAEQLKLIRSSETHEQWRARLPEGVKLGVSDNFDFCDPNSSFMLIEPDGEVRAVSIYEGTVGNILEDDPAVLWSRCLERRAKIEPLFAGVETFADWAQATRALELEVAAPANLERIAARPEYVPLAQLTR